MERAASPRAVFTGCARDCATHLPGVLRNLERLAGLFREVAFVFAENDSSDATRAILDEWAASHAGTTVLRLDGLAARESLRPARIAAARNACLEAIAAGPLRAFERLVVLDLDDVNAGELALEPFRAALEFLDAGETRAAVFANPAPAYFDVWALRHDEWCPRDCWAEVQSAHGLSYAQAVEKFVYARQRAIAADAAPIEVRSAFGGLGIYRLAAALRGRYAGRGRDGRQICEHVPFHESIAGAGSLFIFPPLRNEAPAGHLRARRSAPSSTGSTP